MAILHSVIYPKKYKDKNGTEKTSWIEIGFTTATQNGGLRGYINSIPIGWDGSFILKERDDNRGGPPADAGM
jgi:hypothetical protein